jgi:hypothetical protein
MRDPAGTDFPRPGERDEFEGFREMRPGNLLNGPVRHHVPPDDAVGESRAAHLLECLAGVRLDPPPDRRHIRRHRSPTHSLTFSKASSARRSPVNSESGSARRSTRACAVSGTRSWRSRPRKAATFWWSM